MKKIHCLKRKKSPAKRLSNQQPAGPNFEQGFAHYQAGHLKEAEQCCRAALTADRHHPDALHLLGMTRHQAGDDLSAINFIKKAISFAPEKFFYHLNLGNIHYSRKNHTEAENCYRKALSLNPDFVPTILHLAKNLEQSQRLPEALGYFKKALTLEPDNPLALTGLGNAQLAAGMVKESIATLRKLVKKAPDQPEAHHNLGGALMRFGDIEEAAEQYKKTLELRPDFVETLHNLGLTYEYLGRMDEATECYRQALNVQPSYAIAHYQLAKSQKHQGIDHDILAMENIFDSKELNTHDRMLLAFGLAKAYEDLKLYDKAFDLLEEANSLKRATFQYNLAADAAYFEETKKVFSRSLFKCPARGGGAAEEGSIFVLGMPRSGTSLVEQILASHPDVFGAGELPYLANILASNNIAPASNAALEQQLKRIPTSTLDEMGREYLAMTKSLSKKTETRYIVDKMPHNFMNIGMIKLILPQAKIIHCRRLPLDNCLSIYKNLFDSDHKYAYNMSELGQYYKLYQELMEHWHSVLPDFIHDICYEDLVTDQEKHSRAIFEFCGIPWDCKSLDFHKTGRTVTTLSSSQVRRPIYKDSVKLSEKYGDRLKQLANALMDISPYS